MRLRGFRGDPAGAWRRILVLDLTVPCDPLEDRVLTWARSILARSACLCLVCSWASATSASASAYRRLAASTTDGEALRDVMPDSLLLCCWLRLASGVLRCGASWPPVVAAHSAKPCEMSGFPGVMSDTSSNMELDITLLGAPLSMENPVLSIATIW